MPRKQPFRRSSYAAARRERAALVGLFGSEPRWEAERSLDELAGLADAAGAMAVLRVLQERAKPDPATFLGSGKIAQLAVSCDEMEVDLVIFNHELTPAQLRHVEAALDRKVIDRTQLILDIFARRARTREGQWQVELAQLRYLLPRLVGAGAALSRLGGGIGTRGPGETKLETDRRRIRQRISAVSEAIDQVQARRSQLRERRHRSAVPTVALVGYTNAGKTTLFNALTGQQAEASNALFVTLDPLVRQLRLPDSRELLVSDTVGFIDRLPHTLVAAFRATLEEVKEADLLLHVIDASASEIDRQMSAVHRVLAEVGAAGVPALLVFNKCDLVPEAELARLRRSHPDAIFISAIRGGRFDSHQELIDTVASRLELDTERVTLEFDNRRADDRERIARLYRHARVLRHVLAEDRIQIEADVPRRLLERLRAVVGVLALIAALGLPGCARTERLPAVPVVSSPKYADFVFPGAPANAPAAVTSRHERGWQFLQAGDLRNAKAEFEAALRRQPAFYPSMTGLAYVDLADDKAQPALGAFDKALKASGDYVPALVGRGQALLALGRQDEALESFEAALMKTTDASALADVRRRVDVLRFQSTQSLVAKAREAASAGRHDQARQIYLKAVEASPDSAFLYRELGLEDREAGDLDQALGHLGRASELDPADVRSIVQMGEIHEMKNDLDAAAAAYIKAMTIDASPEIGRKLDALKEKAAVAKLPAEYRAIASAPQLTRGALAALIGVNLSDVLQGARRPVNIVATDARNHWAATWIIPVVSAGVMEVYPNHTFQPGAVVRRGEMAQAVSRTLNLIMTRRPRVGAEWPKARPRIADVNPANLVYPAAAMAVASGVLTLLDGATFQPTRPLTGSEAVAGVERLRQISKQ